MLTTNFSHLRPYDEQLFRLGVLAERYFPDDPNTALLKLRQLGEWLAQEVASRFGVELRVGETQEQLLRRLSMRARWSGRWRSCFMGCGARETRPTTRCTTITPRP